MSLIINLILELILEKFNKEQTVDKDIIIRIKIILF